ncbi:MAG TPA: HDOD domain-containing protein [Opitutaceae bacterium]|nr:HDOD domain-containing protein [Opitutaceae bacterium]
MPPAPRSPDQPTPGQLVSELHQLPPVARVLVRLQRLLSDPVSSLDGVADLIRLDAGLTTRVIQIGNSVWFGRGEPSRTIEDAVSRVGFREIYRLVAVMATDAVVASRLVMYGRDAEKMWQESVVCACAAEILADRLGEDFAVAYTAGLLHAAGRQAINQHLLASAERSPRLNDESFPRDFSVAEVARLGFTQADVGAAMLSKWDFAPAIVEPIRFQYAPLEAGEPHAAMAAILYGARMLRTIVCQQQDPAFLRVDPAVLHRLGLTLAGVAACQPELEAQLKRARKLTATEPVVSR